MSEYLVGSRLQRHDLHKLHALGNDFLIWFRPELPDRAAEQARLWCDRHTGIGADGLIVAIDNRRAPQFVLFNADGGRAEVSGNGLRCFAHAIAARRGVDELELVAATDAGDRPITVRNALTPMATASVSMGVPRPGPELGDLDLASIVEFQRVSTIDVGNPHVVIEVPALDGLDIATIGPAVEAHFLPTGTNVHLVAPADDGVQMLIWERGVGVTQACGSGATAAAAVHAATHRDAESLHVHMPGGSVVVAIGDDLVLDGPSAYVASIDAAELGAAPPPVESGG